MENGMAAAMGMTVGELKSILATMTDDTLVLTPSQFSDTLYVPLLVEDVQIGVAFEEGPGLVFISRDEALEAASAEAASQFPGAELKPGEGMVPAVAFG